MITILVNVLINNKNKLDHFRYSVNSLSTISDDWLINVRGKLRKEALAIAKLTLKSSATFFNLLDDDRGWIHNALTMLNSAKNNYVLLFNEDHSLVASHSLFLSVCHQVQG